MISKISKSVAIAFIIVISWSSAPVDTSRILGLYLSPIQSHLIIHSAIWNGLVERGHNVTVVTTIPVKSRTTNYRHIIADIPGFLESLQEQTAKFTGRRSMLNLFSFELFEFLVKSASGFVRSNEVQTLMNEEKFDLVIVGYLFNEINLGIAAHFKCPAALVWVNYPLTNLHNLVGNPWEVSYVPVSVVGPVHLVHLKDRLINFGLSLFEKWRNIYLYYYSKQYYDEIFPSEKYPSYKDVVENVSLVLVSQYFSEGVVRPSVPAMVEIGGVQVKENPDPLPENLQKLLDAASEHGAIYFSLGSHVKTSTLGPDAIQNIYKVLSSLPQKIIWKWDTETPPGNSTNILFSKWLPQDDILAHPNVRLFISHGGLGSISEAKHHAVPIVGIPLFGDQYMNLEKVHQQGWCRIVDLKELTKSNFREAVQDVLENPTYKETIKEISRVFRDRPMTPLKTAMFWLEYVIRNNGAPHMQSQAVKMGFIEYYSVDVVLLIVFVIYFVYWIIKKAICWMYKKIKARICSKKSKKE